MKTPILKTERLIMRPFKEEDALEVFKCWESDPEVAKYMFWTSHNDLNKTKEWISFEIGQIEKDDWYRFALVLKETGELIGTALIYFEEEVDCWEIGYNLGKRYWGNGYITEAVKEIISFSINQLNISEIVGRYAKENKASAHVMDKLGFLYEKDIPYECNDGAVLREGVLCRLNLESRETEIKHIKSINDEEKIFIELKDTEWPLEYIDHDRQIARAIVFDDEDYFYFVRANRDDDFGKATLIETAGGGVETGEDLHTAIQRELKEELGVSVEIICKLGVVSDYYNLIHRHNINNYFLCKITEFGEKKLTREEVEDFKLSTLKLKYEEAVKEYEKCSGTKLGRLVANREVPVLKCAKKKCSQNREFALQLRQVQK